MAIRKVLLRYRALYRIVDVLFEDMVQECMLYILEYVNETKLFKNGDVNYGILNAIVRFRLYRLANCRVDRNNDFGRNYLEENWNMISIDEFEGGL